MSPRGRWLRRWIAVINHDSSKIVYMRIKRITHIDRMTMLDDIREHLERAEREGCYVARQHSRFREVAL